MNAYNNFTSRLQNWLTEPPELPLVCEIAANYVTALRHRHGQVESWASCALPPGAIRPGPLTDNIVDAAAVQGALEQAVGAIDGQAEQCVLVVPDMLARVVLLEMERLPSRASEAKELLGWRLGKDLPFDLAQAQLSYQAQPGRDGGEEVMVTVCLQSLLRQYEEIVEALKLEPGQVTLSLLATLGWFDESSTTPKLLIKRDPSALAVAIVQGGAVRLFRSMPLPRAASENGMDVLLFEKVLPALVYFQDHWGEPVREVRLCGLGQEAKGLMDRLRTEAECEVAELNAIGLELPPAALTASSPVHSLLPSLGWLQVKQA
jgi:hypothetical protein